ncbi:hypothetical protein [Kocuria palustris]|uniref:hypothetical protein n=1 Tax=Kocuria palustris TaxID=71999 RepID=UPI0011A3DE53|nr:hypothetical protein [Kocuria palustris]
MFSHPAPPPPPQQPRDSEVAGAVELDERWGSAAARWRPQVRPGSREQWSWLRWAWEQLDEGASAATDHPGASEGADPDLRVLDACLALLTAFLQVADARTPGEQAAPSGAQQVRCADGEPMRGAQDADETARELADRCGRTLGFAQLWSLARPEELQEDPWAGLVDGAPETDSGAADLPGEEAARRPLFPLDTDDVAWIVSGSMTADKDRTWRWYSGLTG